MAKHLSRFIWSFLLQRNKRILSSIIVNFACPVGKKKIEINKLKRNVTNKERGTRVWEQVYSGYPGKSSKIADDRERKGSGRRSLMSTANSLDGE